MTWARLDEELRRWRDAGRTPELWWRDDDAAQPSPALERLLALSKAAAVPLALAVVPFSAHEALFAGLAATVLMHGTDHVDRAGAGERKTEFALAEPLEAAAGRIEAARERLQRLAASRFLPVMAPPWNRVKDALLARLPGCGLSGLSRFGARRSPQPAPGVREVNTHVDIIDWRGTRGFVGDEAALGALVEHLSAKLGNKADAGEPTGLLTHHAVHDAASWRFIERAFERSRALGARWVEPAVLFPS